MGGFPHEGGRFLAVAGIALVSLVCFVVRTYTHPPLSYTVDELKKRQQQQREGAIDPLLTKAWD